MAHKVNKADIPPLLGDAGVFRVVIHGNSGTGKSTLASRLGPILNVPVLHLDKIYWRPNWVGAPAEEVTAEVQNFIDDSARKNIGWVIDGNYESVVKGIADSAATDIIWLDPPFYKYFPLVVLRTFQRLFGFGPPCAPGCEESWREVFFSSKSILWWVITHHNVSRSRYSARYESQNITQGGRYQRLASISEYNKWLESVQKLVK